MLWLATTLYEVFYVLLSLQNNQGQENTLRISCRSSFQCLSQYFYVKYQNINLKFIPSLSIYL
jgi:hypothetical protein